MGDSNVRNIVMPGGVQGISIINGKMDGRSGVEAPSSITIDYTDGNMTVTVVTKKVGNSLGEKKEVDEEKKEGDKAVTEKTEDKKNEDAKEEKKEKPITTEKTEEKAPAVPSEASPGMSLH